MRGFGLLILSLLSLSAAPAYAACQGETVFSCQIGKKQVEVCLNGNEALYQFGPKGAPEIRLSDSIAGLDYQPWRGIGRNIYEAVTFYNDHTSYVVWSNFDRLGENAEVQGGIQVLEYDGLIAELVCRPGTTEAGLDLFWSAKEEQGQCWNDQEQHWQKAPCP